jgi:tetratricopeptide (TPR) repeat protein
MSTHIGIGDAYRKVPGGGGEAMTNYEFVTEKDAKNSLAYSRIGDLWYDARNYQSALDNYAKAKEADASNPLPYKSLADAYSRSGRYKLALENIKQYLTLSDNTMDDQIDYARILYLAQSYCDAATNAKQILNNQLSPAGTTEMYGILGFSQAECGDSIEAMKNIRTYFAMQNPKNITPGAYIQYGKLLLKLNMLDSAGYYYTKGIAGDTAQNKTDVYRQIAEAFKSKKEYCKSAEWYNNLIKANPSTQAGDYAWRSIMYYYCKDYTNGMASATDFATKHPDQPSAIYWQGRIQMAVDSEATTGSAEQYFIKWLAMPGDKKPNDLKGAYTYLMYYYFHKGDKENLTVYKEKIRAIDPKDRSLMEIEEAEKAPAAKPTKTKTKVK